MQLSKSSFKKIMIALAVIALAVIIYAVIDNLSEKEKQAEINRPAELSAIKLVDENCPNCFDLNYLLTVLKKQNVSFSKIEEVDISSEKGKELMKEHNIIKVPILFIQGEIEKNESFLKLWEGFGEKKENILISDVFPPYNDLKNEKIVGLIDMTVIYDKNCKECYNTKVHNQLLEAEGIVPVNTKKLDVHEPEAIELIEKYNIEKVPTIILTSEAKYYKRLNDDWSNDGFVADDGNYIFTATEKIGVYKDLTTDQIITPNN